jgi:hypothetical protein
MAKRNRSKNRPQPQHKTKRQASQHDKRKRLECPNPDRKKTTRAKFPLVGAMQVAVAVLQAVLDRRIAFRLAIIAAGMLFGDGRCTASCWFAAAGVQDDWDRFYDCLISIGRRSRKLATAVLGLVARKFDPGPEGRILVVVDDSPTKRSGPHVEGAGVHHNPTPGPADGEWLYGHVWVTLCWLAQHPRWGTIALPLWSLLYVRAVDVPKLDQQRGWQFRTKHQLAAELVLWFVATLRSLGLQAKVWVVADGAYAARPFLDAVRAKGVVVVSRLRKDARLWDLPAARKPGQRGRPRIYGPHAISLAKRAGQRRGWQPITYNCRGVEVTREYKTFEATTRLVSGKIRVVLLRDDQQRWVAYFCTDPTAEVRDILEAVASRWAIEEQFHDVKEVWGAGEQQVRNVWSNIACWNLNQWMYTLVELCTWDQPQSALSDRSGRPWDNPNRRPSHADRRRSIAREILGKELFTVLGDTPDPQKFRRLAERLFDLCV